MIGHRSENWVPTGESVSGVGSESRRSASSTCEAERLATDVWKPDSLSSRLTCSTIASGVCFISRRERVPMRCVPHWRISTGVACT